MQREWDRQTALRILEGVQCSYEVTREQVELLDLLGVDHLRFRNDSFKIRQLALAAIDERWPDVAV